MDQQEFLKEFNTAFENELAKKQMQYNLKKQELLLKLNENANKPVYIYQNSISEIFWGIGNTFFGILKDMETLNFDKIFTKDDRLFYIGITILLFTFILILILFFSNRLI